MTGISLVSWLWRPVGRWREIGWGDVVLAGVLSLYAMGLVSGVLKTGRPHGGVVAAVAVLAMTLPVAWERQAPAAAAAAVAAGAVVNELLIGPMVRCGPALPAVLVIAFFAGTRLDGRRLAVAVACCLGAVTTQAFFDPRLGAGFLVAGLPVVAGFCLAGRLARSRGLAAAALRERNAELREQREQTARLAVTAGAQGAFAAVADSGRATLSQMRAVVGTLREEALTEPQPVLAQLGGLLERATSADARLHVEGSPRALPAGIELSGYRIVEHMVTALEDAPEVRIDVWVRFGHDALELQIAGPASRYADRLAAFAVARERAALLGGTLRIETGSGRCAALVRLPLTAGYAHS